MSTVSMLEFRRNAGDVIRRLQHGQPMVLSYRGKPIARLEPIQDDAPRPGDSFYSLCDLAEDRGLSLTNADIDKTVYGT